MDVISETEIDGLPPDFHDGRLTGVWVDDSILVLHCSTVDGDRYLWRVVGLRRLRADNFLEGNIIFEVNVHRHGPPADLVKKAFGEEGVADPPWLHAELSRLRDRNAIVIELTSSYGCELVAIADAFSIEKVGG